MGGAALPQRLVPPPGVLRPMPRNVPEAAGGGGHGMSSRGDTRQGHNHVLQGLGGGPGAPTLVRGVSWRSGSSRVKRGEL